MAPSVHFTMVKSRAYRISRLRSGQSLLFLGLQLCWESGCSSGARKGPARFLGNDACGEFPTSTQAVANGQFAAIPPFDGCRAVEASHLAVYGALSIVRHF